LLPRWRHGRAMPRAAGRGGACVSSAGDAGTMKPYGILVLVLACLLAIGVSAQEGASAREEAFVYATTHFDGLTYGSAVVTPDVDTLYLIANVENIVAPRNTLIYYWALTDEYLADWSRR